MDKIIQKRAIFRHDLLRRQDFERNGWVIVEDNEAHDLVVYGLSSMSAKMHHAKKKANSLFNRITRSIKNGITRSMLWKR